MFTTVDCISELRECGRKFHVIECRDIIARAHIDYDREIIMVRPSIRGLDRLKLLAEVREEIRSDLS